MVRERVKNRVFPDRYIVPSPVDEKPFDFNTLYASPQPLEVDIGCGRGRFILARATGNSSTNFLGLDRSLIRLKKIDRKAVAAGLTNVRLMHGEALRLLPLLKARSVQTFYLFFPDPWPKRRHHPNRLVAQPFLDLVFNALVPGGHLHLCTDHNDYFAHMLKHVSLDTRFTEVPPFVPTDEEETDFGLIFRTQNRPANRCSLRKT